jgi:hypothetical protein
MTVENAAAFPPPSKTLKQEQAIGDALWKTMTKLTKAGYHQVHVLETMLSIATSGCAHYGGNRELARLLRMVAETCDQWADAEEKDPSLFRN